MPEVSKCWLAESEFRGLLIKECKGNQLSIIQLFEWLWIVYNDSGTVLQPPKFSLLDNESSAISGFSKYFRSRDIANQPTIRR